MVTVLGAAQSREKLFEGDIEAIYGRFARLMLLDLAGNVLEGTLPCQLGFLTQLERIEIGNNAFTGTIVVEFALLSNLKYLDISNYTLSCPLPKELGNLKAFCFFKNSFTGEIRLCKLHFTFKIPNPKQSSQRVVKLFMLASLAKLTGEIPDFIGGKNVYKIELQGNSLNGSICWYIDHCEKLIFEFKQKFVYWNNSMEISTLPSINVVDISHNLLTRTIPSNFENCSTLENFDVSYNLLTGPIPSSARPCPVEAMAIGDMERLNFTADDVLECLSMTDKIIGMDHRVYKAEMPGGEIIAMKKLCGCCSNRECTIAWQEQRGELGGRLGDKASHGIVNLLHGWRIIVIGDLEFGNGNNIVDWVRSKIKSKNRITDILGKNVGASVRGRMVQMLRTTLLCSSWNSTDWPLMRDVVMMLCKKSGPRGNSGSYWS
ncbi:hypothetical protein F3Y22_tig00000002pilonHSYRG00223 [Hibiscus syriacus]|uniref:Uncharacterized protein n=1 Tax=Hibiscus syriacus TaxID=106335 RepID=A0A6A3D8Z3_HIBSY|nr:hypothetical protein F3Y22_tig00000002pilonHSYRG00223 [Hibiscus syriacus]